MPTGQEAGGFRPLSLGELSSSAYRHGSHPWRICEAVQDRREDCPALCFTRDVDLVLVFLAIKAVYLGREF